MKLKNEKNDLVDVTWSDHAPGCAKCREVDLDRPASFAAACAQGSALLQEEMIRRQAPVVRQKSAEVRKWAEKTGVFKVK